MEPSSLKDLAEGIDIPCELRIPAEPPPWLDKGPYLCDVHEIFRFVDTLPPSTAFGTDLLAYCDTLGT